MVGGGGGGVVPLSIALVYEVGFARNPVPGFCCFPPIEKISSDSKVLLNNNLSNAFSSNTFNLSNKACLFGG